ncbi:hypothetical protein IMZ48_25275 [Candidatus Bathyarchaeota archaeon]|nr:hypothetical protein [Candidatus Bathyarchaeota archaeon]
MELVNQHSTCPKCGAAADGSSKSCSACGAVCRLSSPLLSSPTSPSHPPNAAFLFFTHLLGFS